MKSSRKTCRLEELKRKRRLATVDTETGRSPIPPPLQLCQSLAQSTLEAPNALARCASGHSPVALGEGGHQDVLRSPKGQRGTVASGED